MLNMVKKTIPFIVLIISVFLMVFAIKGDKGNSLYFQTEKDTRIMGPFEGSGSTSRYALTEAIAKNHTFFLDKNLAKFSSPDVSEYKGKFLTVFTPGISFLGVPLYMIGQVFHVPQLGAYTLNIILVLINLFLIAKLSIRLGANIYSGLLSGIAFVFATNAFVYASSYTQHLATTTLILLAILNLFGERNIWKNIWLGMLFGASVLMDIPNVIFMAPIVSYTLLKHVNIFDVKNKLVVSFRLISLFIVIGILPFLMLFGWYNYQTTGSYTLIGQSIGTTELFRDVQPRQRPLKDYPVEKLSNLKLLNTPFNTRDELNSSYILLLSDERSWLYYSPVVLLGIIGWWIIYKSGKNKDIALTICAVVLVSILIYSMFSDPWGGWAFGSRYLIPSAAILCVSLGNLIERYRNSIFTIIFFIIFGYSVFVNTVGAVTTSMVPPKIEAINLKPKIPYTYKYNLNFINSDKSGSLAYNIIFYKFIKVSTFTEVICILLIFEAAVLYLLSYRYNTKA